MVLSNVKDLKRDYNIPNTGSESEETQELIVLLLKDILDELIKANVVK